MNDERVYSNVWMINVSTTTAATAVTVPAAADDFVVATTTTTSTTITQSTINRFLFWFNGDTR